MKDVNLTQTDLIAYVIQKEVEKVEVKLKAVSEKLDVARAKHNEFQEKYLTEVFEKAKEEKKGIISVFTDANPELEVNFCSDSLLSNDCTIKIDSSIWILIGKKMPNNHYYSEVRKGITINAGCNRRNTITMICESVFKYPVPEKIFKEKEEDFNSLDKELKELSEEHAKLNSEIAQIKHSKDKITAKFIQEVLSQTEDGQAMLKTLDNLSLTTLQLTAGKEKK